MFALREHMKISDVQRKLVKTPVQVRRFEINARLLERWLLKALLNLTFESRYLIGWQGTETGRPPEDLVKVVFGRSSFNGMAGMYVGGRLGQLFTLGEHLQFFPLVKDDRYILGGFFKVGGILLYLCLDQEGVKVPFNAIPGIDQDWSATELKWRFRKIKAKHGRYLSHVIDFKW